MPLTALKIKNLKAKDRKYRIADSEGLCIEVKVNGGKWWRWRYRFAGKEQLISVGRYPAVTLVEARRKRDELIQLVAAGKHPGRERKSEKSRRALCHANDFETVAVIWHKNLENTLNPKYHKQLLTRLKTHVFPQIGFLPISEITIPDVADAVEKIARKGIIVTAKQLRQTMSQIFCYAALKGLCKFNPAADLRGLLPKRKKKHHACIKTEELPTLLRAIDGHEGHVLTKAALKLVALTFVRTNELIGAKWSEFDLERAEWNIPAERMKMRRPHFVPLSKQSIDVLKELRAITGTKEFVFHSRRGKKNPHISNGAMLMALRRMGYAGRMTGHGFRSLASTILNGARRHDGTRKYDADVIEAQLAHGDDDEVRSAYNHADYRQARVTLMQDWADILDSEKSRDTNVVYFSPNEFSTTRLALKSSLPVSSPMLVVGWNLLIRDVSELAERNRDQLFSSTG